jgi:hypothetical protein
MTSSRDVTASPLYIERHAEKWAAKLHVYYKSYFQTSGIILGKRDSNCFDKSECHWMCSSFPIKAQFRLYHAQVWSQKVIYSPHCRHCQYAYTWQVHQDSLSEQSTNLVNSKCPDMLKVNKINGLRSIYNWRYLLEVWKEYAGLMTPVIREQG